VALKKGKKTAGKTKSKKSGGKSYVPFKSGSQNRDRNILLLVGGIALVVVLLAWWLGSGGKLGGLVDGKTSRRAKAPAAKQASQAKPSGKKASKASGSGGVKPGQKGGAAASGTGQPGRMGDYPKGAADQAGQRFKTSEPMDAMVSSLSKTGLDVSRIKISLANKTGQEIVVLELALPKDAKPRDIQDSLSKLLKKSGQQVSWQIQKERMVAELSSNGIPTHRLVLRLPPGVKLKPEAKPDEQTGEPVRPGQADKPLVAIIIDDMGYQIKPAKQLLAMDLNLSFAVLPNSPHAKKVAAMIKAKGRDMILHLPMQPKEYPKENPGANALLLDLDAAELERLTRLNLDAVPGVIGVNNHMGSAFTEDDKALEPVLREIKRRGLFFLDSLTSSKSQVCSMAREMGIRTTRRDLFLDHDHDPDVIMDVVAQLIRLAEKNGRAIAIGHPIPSTIKVLSEVQDTLKSRVRLVPLSRLIPSD
jgi:polysaccharide deacetylase 2 family uncharacterized protein YibQ